MNSTSRHRIIPGDLTVPLNRLKVMLIMLIWCSPCDRNALRQRKGNTATGAMETQPKAEQGKPLPASTSNAVDAAGTQRKAEARKLLQLTCEHCPPQSTGGPTKGTGRHFVFSEPGSGWHLAGNEPTLGLVVFLLQLPSHWWSCRKGKRVAIALLWLS